MDQTVLSHANPLRAFTLIELLVVITIIVILLAILTPALDSAIYQAELTKCAANLKAIATGAIMYSQSNKQSFPYRDAIETTSLVGGTATNQGLQGTGNLTADGDNMNSADVLKTTAGYHYRRANSLAEGAGHDDRARLRPYISMKAMLDPLCGGSKIDLDHADGANTIYIFSDYTLFFGMHYERKTNGPFRKYGTPLQLYDHFLTTMAVDTDVANAGADIGSVNSHPDDKGLSTLHVQNNVGGYLDAKWTAPASPLTRMRAGRPT